MSTVPDPATPTVPPPGEFAPEAKRAVYDVIALRRDIRNFRPDAVPDEVLLRILGAAHRAGSVGYMQPWDFVLLRSAERKADVYELFRQANERAATRWEGDRRARYGALKLQGVLDAPLSVCVTCDTTRGGPHVLGRDTIRETDVYSTCLAIQNFWLAARAEGVGVGWVSIVDPRALAAVLGLPAGVIPVAFLCVGYPVEFPETPLLEAIGWRERLEIARLLHFERWGAAAGEEWQGLWERLRDGAETGAERDAAPAPGRASPAIAPVPGDAFDARSLAAAVPAADPGGERATRIHARLDALVKPRGSLGRLESLAVRLARAQASDFPTADRATVVLFAGDHGICEEGVSAYRGEATAQLCYNFVAGGGVINALARQHGAELVVVDVGVAHDFGGATGIRHRKVVAGTRNFARGPALTREEVAAAVRAGAAEVAGLGPTDVLLLAEAGIGNTTSSAALLALLTGSDAAAVVGAGTGVGAETLQRKRDVVRRAIELHGDAAHDPFAALAAVGGCETAAMTGAILAAAARRIPVLLDGFITGVAALAAVRLAPSAAEYLIAAHRGAEPGHALVLDALGLEPLLEMELRLGEGSGAALALPLLRSACALLREVRTLREAGIRDPADPSGLL